MHRCPCGPASLEPERDGKKEGPGGTDDDIAYTANGSFRRPKNQREEHNTQRDPSVLLLLIRRVLFIFKMLMMREKVRFRHKYQGLRSAAGATAGY